MCGEQFFHTLGVIRAFLPLPASTGPPTSQDKAWQPISQSLLLGGHLSEHHRNAIRDDGGEGGASKTTAETQQGGHGWDTGGPSRDTTPGHHRDNQRGAQEGDMRPAQPAISIVWQGRLGARARPPSVPGEAACRNDNWEQLFRFFKRNNIPIGKMDFEPVNMSLAPRALALLVRWSEQSSSASL